MSSSQVMRMTHGMFTTRTFTGIAFQVRAECSPGDSGRFTAVTAEILRLSSLGNRVPKDRGLAADIALVSHCTVPAGNGRPRWFETPRISANFVYLIARQSMNRRFDESPSIFVDSIDATQSRLVENRVVS